VICGRSFDFSKRFLPDGLSKVDRLNFLNADEQRLLSQIQGRTYANMFGLYFLKVCGRSLPSQEAERIRAGVLAAYRWQYIVSGVQEPRFSQILASMISQSQATRIGDALAPIM
jgi:hypothetical protein